jgi:hypothetical protein
MSHRDVGMGHMLQRRVIDILIAGAARGSGA